MKFINTEDAVGHVLCHDLTRIVPGVSKDAAFRKGHVVTGEDIPVLLSMGKERLFVWEMEDGMLHEDDAARRLLALCLDGNMTYSEPKEGKIELFASIDGLFTVDTGRLFALNSRDGITIASRHGNTPVKKGGKLAGLRVIPLVIGEDRIKEAEALAGKEPVFRLLPWKIHTAAVVTTGNEVAKGLVEDAFTPVVREKLAAFGISVIYHSVSRDGAEILTAEIGRARASGAELIICTGGMSVDPDDSTPGAIRKSGARVVRYGAPVLPGSMLLVGYYSGGTPVLGLPGCVMYAKSTIFDILLPRIAAGVPIEDADIAALGHGGLCLGCESCRYPDCSFGKV